MACSLARRAARLAIVKLRCLETKTPPQSGGVGMGSREGEADRAHGGRSTGDLTSVGEHGPRTDEHLLQLPEEAYRDRGKPATIFMAGSRNFTLGAVQHHLHCMQ